MKTIIIRAKVPDNCKDFEILGADVKLKLSSLPYMEVSVENKIIPRPTDEEIESESKRYDNAMTSIAEGVWMPLGVRTGARWICSQIWGDEG